MAHTAGRANGGAAGEPTEPGAQRGVEGLIMGVAGK